VQTFTTAISFVLVCVHHVTKIQYRQHMQQKFALSSNGKKSFNPVVNPDADLDHHRNLIIYKLS